MVTFVIFLLACLGIAAYGIYLGWQLRITYLEWRDLKESDRAESETTTPNEVAR